MSYRQGLYPIIKTENLAYNIFSIEIYCPHIVSQTKPGQFLNIKIDGFFLRRPISICSVDKNNGTLRIVFAIKGEGTKKLSELHEGMTADILAPLGNGFTIEKDKKIILVGGGIGVPPMVSLSQEYKKNSIAISGFRDVSLVILQKELQENCQNTILCTDDGSAGIHGFVTEPLEDLLKKGGYDEIAACGPLPMLKNIAKVAEKYDVPCEVSMEERMGCGIGACLVCEIDAKTENGEIVTKHVCKDGPVFDSKEVFF